MTHCSNDTRPNANKIPSNAYLLRTVSILGVLVLAALMGSSQCKPLPYRENFEANDGGWKTGGVASDWEWGTPAKSKLVPIDGKKCWTTGGLTKSSYNSGEYSWLQSPCFNFSTIKHPYIVFRYFLDTETNFDGATMEYSTDYGISWKTAGSINDPKNCLNWNWFNTSNIRYANNSQGWSGSNFWLWANHTFPSFAGNSNVTFRFVFGAGTINNNYNGFAIDDFYAGEADSTDASFSYKCTSHTTVDFTALSNKGCPVYAWNFDDPASGAANTSDQMTLSHTFSKPGQYKVTLATMGIDNTPSLTTQVINIYGASTKVISQPVCSGDNTGAAVVSITPAAGAAVYSWNTNPVQSSDTAIGLMAGTYQVQVTIPNACPVNDSITIADPAPLSSSTITTQPDCNKNNGSIQLGTTGGTAPYTYTWTPNFSTSAAGTNLPAGQYSILVSDASGCTETVRILLTPANAPVAQISSKKDPLCWGNGGNATVSATGGVAPYTYAWAPTGGNNPSANFSVGGSYSVVVTDVNGCMDSARVDIIEPAVLTSVIDKKDATCGAGNGEATALISGGVLPYAYLWASSAGTFSSQTINNLVADNYYLTATDNNGCKVSDQVSIAPGSSIKVVVSHTDVACFGGATGSAALLISGGTPAYSVSWNNGASGASLIDLKAGDYSAAIKDAAGCSLTTSITIAQPPKLVTSIIATDAICGNKNGTLASNVAGGKLPYQYFWTTIPSTAPAINAVAPGDYSLFITDINGCKDSATATILDVNPLKVSLGKDTTICTPAMIILTPGSFRQYTWQDGSVAPTLSVSREGRYSVNVIDDRGCIAGSSIDIVADCGKVYFPGAFTPNGDNRNDRFGPLGNLALIKNYELRIFNRWGQLVFKSSNPFEKWDGRTGDQHLGGAYTWIARYTTALEPAGKQKGTVLLIF